MVPKGACALGKCKGKPKSVIQGAPMEPPRGISVLECLLLILTHGEAATSSEHLTAPDGWDHSSAEMGVP